MGKRRNRPRGAIRPTSYTGTRGQTFTADQVTAMLAAAQRTQDGATAPVAKAFGNAIPAAIAAAEAQQQMTPGSPFSPGEPISPYDGFSRQPRTRDFEPSYNVATRPRVHERVSFETLTGLIDAYDVAQIAIWHRIDTLRSVKYRLVAADWYSGDVEGAVKLGQQVFRKPDRRHNFKNWLGKWLYDVLAYDAAPLYRLRNRGGQCIGLLPVDGTTIAPLLDYWGNEPEPPAESHVQYVQGLPWNWLTRDDLIYEPMRAVNKSVYGKAPIESIVLNANTDIRFQLHFLQRFTEGNIPEAFASSPETWTPDQIDQFQQYWDSFMYGDQSRKHQIRWMPGGSTISWTNERDFTDEFSLFMMRKTCACFHVVPTDLGFTDNANYSTGESQADVAHKVGELPLMEYVEEILSQFLVDDLGLPLKFEFDKGEDQDDRATQAQADQTYINSAVVSADEIREMRFGLPTDKTRPVPRIFLTERGGPIPLNAVLGVSGKNDPETGSPSSGEKLPQMVFPGTPGVLDAQVLQNPLAVDEFGPKALPAAPLEQPEPPGQPAPVGKEAAAGDGGSGPSEGINSGTGIYGDPLQAGEDDEDEFAFRPEVVKSELAAFKRYARGRRKAGVWRDFRFDATDIVTAHRLNDSGRLAVRKAAGEIAVAGLAVLAADTGRVLMLQRALSDDDPAAGTWEFPGGHLEGDETPLAGAWREWSEETGVAPPPGVQTGSWTANGIYQGIVWTCERESMVPVRCDTQIVNPDDPDGDSAESIAWWDPATIPGNPAVRPELLASADDVMAALGCASPDDSEAAEPVQKAGGADLKAPEADGRQPPVQSAWPGWDLDLQTAAYWAPLLAAAFAGAFSIGALVRAWMTLTPASDASTKPERIRELTAQARDWLADRGTSLDTAITDTMRGVLTDGYAIGGASADAAAEAAQAGQQAGSIAADMGSWKPGATGVARELAGSLGDGSGQGLRDLLDQAGVQIKSIADSRIGDLAKVLAEGAERGDSAEDLASAIEDMLSDPSRAEMIVMTELARAANNAAAWAYRFHGIRDARFVTCEDDKVCPACDAEEAAGSRPLNEVPQPPLHPRCRCAIVPA